MAKEKGNHESTKAGRHERRQYRGVHDFMRSGEMPRRRLFGPPFLCSKSFREDQQDESESFSGLLPRRNRNFKAFLSQSVNEGMVA